MLHGIKDILSRVSVSEGTELEIRFPIPYNRFHGLRQLFGAGKNATYTKAEVIYNDKNDIRCVGTEWQRKRLALFENLQCPIPCRLCVSVESKCMAPESMVNYRSVVRSRWSYKFEDWKVDWTHSKRSSNVEIEFTGNLDQLVATRDLSTLDLPLKSVLAHLTCLAYGRSKKNKPTPFVKHMPFAPYYGSSCPVSAKTCLMYNRYMAAAQPVSLADGSINLENYVVSLKYDGIRMVISAHKYLGLDVAWGLGRRDGLWSIPCTNVPEDVVLDCEVMLKSKQIVVFDVWQRGRVPCTNMTYGQRLQLLAELKLPSFLDYTIIRKTFYPFASVSTGWYETEKAQHKIDGLIFHDRQTKLGERGNLFKWKPNHTVDLEVGTSNLLVDRLKYSFLPCVQDHGQVLRKGQIWECAIEDNHVRPLYLRTDKLKANAHHVCEEILQAHKARITLDDLAKNASVENKKRKRESI